MYIQGFKTQEIVVGQLCGTDSCSTRESDNQFMPRGYFHSYILDELICHLRVSGL